MLKYIFILLSLPFAHALCSLKYGPINSHGRLDIDDGVTVVKQGAFNSCEKIKSIFLPDSLQVIQEKAFANTPLQRVLGGDGLRTVRNYAFGNCTKLRLFDPSNVTVAEFYAFNNTYMHAISENPYTFIFMKIREDGSIVF